MLYIERIGRVVGELDGNGGFSAHDVSGNRQRDKGSIRAETGRVEGLPH